MYNDAKLNAILAVEGCPQVPLGARVLVHAALQNCPKCPLSCWPKGGDEFMEEMTFERALKLKVLNNREGHSPNVCCLPDLISQHATVIFSS